MSPLSFIRKQRALSRLLLLVLLFGVTYSINVKPARAVGIPFGGLVTSMTYCTCSGNFLVALSLPRPGLYTYSPYSSFLFMNYLVAPGSWLLGTYIPGVQACWFYVGAGCAPFPNLGVISMTGTTL